MHIVILLSMSNLNHEKKLGLSLTLVLRHCYDMASDCGAAASGSNSKNSKEALGVEETISAIPPTVPHLYYNQTLSPPNHLTSLLSSPPLYKPTPASPTRCSQQRHPTTQCPTP